MRLDRVSEQMRHVISTVVTQELRDPRCGFVTIVDVKVAPDLKTARVEFSVFGPEQQKRLAVRALEHARGYIQARVAEEMPMKYTPVINLVLNESVERDIVMQQKINDVIRADKRVSVARAIRVRTATAVPEEIRDALTAYLNSDELASFVSGVLARLAATNGEKEFLGAVERIIGEIDSSTTLEDVPIDPGIEQDPAYTSHPDGRAREVYHNRANLLATMPATENAEHENGEAAPIRLLLNTSVDVGGAGQAAMILSVLRALAHIKAEFGYALLSELGIEFLIDANTGNGTLCAALQDAFPCDGYVSCAPTGLSIANAGVGKVHLTATLKKPASEAAGKELLAAITTAVDEQVAHIAPADPAKCERAIWDIGECDEITSLTIVAPLAHSQRIHDATSLLERSVRRAVTAFCVRTKTNEDSLGLAFRAGGTEGFFRERDSALVVYAEESAKQAGVAHQMVELTRPVDARHFANVFPTRELIVFGPGEPGGSNITLPDVLAGVKLLTYLIVNSAGLRR